MKLLQKSLTVCPKEQIIKLFLYSFIICLLGLMTSNGYCDEGFKIIKDASEESGKVLNGPIKTAIESMMAIGGGWAYFISKSITPIIGAAAGIGLLEFLVSHITN